MTLIFNNISKHISFNKKEKAYFKNIISEEKIDKNSFILKQGEPCQHIYFINSGILRAYYINTEGKESTIMFGLKDWWITDMYSFLNELPAIVNIQAVQNSSVLKLSKENLDKLYSEIPQFNQYFRILMQNAYCREQLRMIQNLSLPAKERYERFIHKYPQIIENVTLKQIASYLGITPEFLSAIRGTK